jgi:hypothetical protein
VSGFLILHWPKNIDPHVVDNVRIRSCRGLRGSHPLSGPPTTAFLEVEGFCCVKLDTPDSPSTNIYKDTTDGSLVYMLGTATYEGQRVTDSVLGRLLADIRQDPLLVSSRLDGVYVAIAYDSVREQVVAIPSALGQFAVYKRSMSEGLVALSSSILALAALDKVTLDEFGCYSLYRCGHRLPPHTVFREIQSIAEGSFIEVGNGRLSIKRYWIPPFGKSVGTISTASADISHHLSNYCTALIDPDQSVFSDLTGGLDSRVTTASLLNAGISFTATVAGSEDHPDVVLARRICDDEHLPFQAVDTSKHFDDVASTMGAALFLAEGCIDTFACALTTLIKQQLFPIPGASPAVSVSGALGECYRDFFWAQEFLDRGKRRRASVDKLIRYRFDAIPRRMDFFAHDWHREWRSQLHQYLDQIVDSYDGERNTAQIDAVYLRKMSGAIGGFSSAFGKFSTPLLPFTSRRAMDVALAVPAQWRYNSRLLRNVAWFLSPRLARYLTLGGFPCAPVSSTNWYKFLPKYMADTKRLVRKASAVFLHRTILAEYTEPAPEQNPCAPLIEKEMRPGGCFDRNCMHTAEWYAPHTLAALFQEARLPNGFHYRGAVSWIYTCEAMARTAEDLLNTDSHVHSAAYAG